MGCTRQVYFQLALTERLCLNLFVPSLLLISSLPLYHLQGSSACFLRDVPFSALYFPLYAHMKRFTADKDGLNGPFSLFVSGFVAGEDDVFVCSV